MSAETTKRDSLNSANLNRLADALRLLGFGELLSVIISGLAKTETGATITSHVCTMAQAAVAVFQVNGIGGTAGTKKLRQGAITGTGALVPLPGEVIWDGGSKLLFNTADANTTCDLVYSKADLTQAASCLLGQLDK